MTNITVTSAILLTEVEKKDIEKNLSHLVTGTDKVTYVVDSAILGGLQVMIGTKRIDLSLAGKLSQVRSAVLQ